MNNITFLQWSLKKPLIRLAPVLVIPLQRFVTSGNLLDFFVSFIFILIANYIWYKYDTNEKGRRIMEEVNSTGGIAVTALIVVAIFGGMYGAFIILAIWAFVIYWNLKK